ncbi:MAG: ScyD/ScyE family protein [Bacteroidota bacterium]|nr:ScyD/ScyE family protein [Bacteroidota bacterium]
MNTKISARLMIMSISTLVFTSCNKHDHSPQCDGNDKTVTTIKVFATGLNNPRGLKFGQDGNLYVAEGGIGGTNSTIGQCTQVPATGPGPSTGSDSGSRISKIDRQGKRTTFVNYLPSSQTNEASGKAVTGMADVAFIGNTLYGLIGGGGCSHGVSSIPNGIAKAGSNGSWSLAANYSQYILAHPGVNYEEEDYTPDGNPWNMISVDKDFYLTEANTGVLDKISSKGTVSRVVDISATQGHIVPTALTHHAGSFYVGNLGLFPIIVGSSKVFQITHDGQISVYASGFTTIVGLAFDNRGRLYVLELSDGPGGPTPNLGKIIRVDKLGNRQVIASGLNFPTAMTFGPDGNLYVSGSGIGAPGTGQVLQIGFKCELVLGDINIFN